MKYGTVLKRKTMSKIENLKYSKVIQKKNKKISFEKERQKTHLRKAKELY